MEETLEKLGFPLGSRVIMVGEDPTHYVAPGRRGVVCDYVSCFDDGCNIGVRWDERSSSFHDCMGICDSEHGRYVPHTSLVLEQPDLGQIELSEMDIGLLF